MSLSTAWPHVLEFFGTPLVIEPSPGQLSSDAGLLPVRQFHERIGRTYRSETWAVESWWVVQVGKKNGYAENYSSGVPKWWSRQQDCLQVRFHDGTVSGQQSPLT